MLHGLLIIDKPEGMTSAEAVRVLKRRAQCKVGHLGTLDPFASGVLPLCVGEGTKIAQFLNCADKEYTGIIRLGAQTDTGDLSGAVMRTAPVPPVSSAQLSAVGRQFEGDSLQIPPMYSAIKQGGVPLYKLARQGLAVERAPRRVHIASFQLTIHGSSALAFSVSCSKGTYIRVLAQQVAAALGTAGHLEQLRRTRFGRFGVADSIPLAAVESSAIPAESLPVIGLREALGHLREIRIDAAAEQRARRGYQPFLLTLAPGGGDEIAKLIGPDNDLVAVIATDVHGRWQFARVLRKVPCQ
jgi:tRNA pseudouridine55 synthase